MELVHILRKKIITINREMIVRTPKRKEIRERVAQMERIKKVEIMFQQVATRKEIVMEQMAMNLILRVMKQLMAKKRTSKEIMKWLMMKR
jgi:hypothetical protein